MSRINFHRQLPNTRQYLLDKLHAIEFYGHHQFAENTFSNMMPVLTGLTVDELHEACWPTMADRFDDCRFLWDDFHEAGYVTAFAEDIAWRGIFNYLKYGFSKQPVDHLYATMDMQAQSDIGYESYGNSKLCQAGRLTLDYLLDYTVKFVKSNKILNQNFFGIFWEASITHDQYYYDPKVDDRYENMFQQLNSLGTFENTVLIVMSDHALRWGGLCSQAKYENKLPALFVAVPKWLKRVHPELEINLPENARKLTSPFDVYKTLQAIVGGNYMEMGNEYGPGLNLFSHIPENRSCNAAGIPYHWCVCQ